MRKFYKYILFAACLWQPLTALAFSYETDLQLKPDIKRYSQWCYIEFTESHRGWPSNPPPDLWSSLIITLPNEAKAMQLTWFSPDAAMQNPSKYVSAQIEQFPTPEKNENTVMLRTIKYWDLPWKLFVGFDVGSKDSPTSESLKPCDAKQFTPEY